MKSVIKKQVVVEVKRCLDKVLNRSFIISFLVMAFVLAVVNGIVFSNLSTCVSDRYEEKRLNLSLMGAECENAELLQDGTVLLDQSGGALHILGVDCEVHTVTIVSDPGQDQIVDGTILCKDEGHAYRQAQNQVFRLNKKYHTVTRSFQTQGKCSDIKLQVGTSDHGVLIKEVIVNQQEAFHFRMGTYLIMLCTGCILLLLHRLGCLGAQMDLKRIPQRAALLTGVLIPVGLALCIGIASCRQGETLLFPYEKGNIDDMPMQQMMLFDAFHHGSVRIAKEVDPNYLVMDNVYDESERIAKSFQSEWDLAFYNGSYYSYFGALPILVIYEICYILTGALPGINFSMFIVSVFGIIGFFMASYRMLAYFRIKPVLFDYIVGNWAMMMASFYFISTVNSDQYTLPIVFCLGFLLHGVAAAFAAVMETKPKKRVARYVWCGICLVGVVMLRPAVLLLFLAFVMPLFIGVLLDRDMQLTAKIRDVVSFAVPVILGAAVVMTYNYLRFDSPFEFGARYQLTVSDIRYNHTTLNLNTLLAAVYHYGFEGLNFKSYFPFLFFNMDPTITYGKLVYHEAVMGVFMMPFNLLSFGILGIGKKTEKKQGRMILYAVFLASAVLMLLDFGMGGLVGRYTADFAIGFSFVAFYIWMKMSAESDRSWSFKRIGGFIIVITLVMGFLLLFSNDPVKFQIAREQPDIYMFFANLFDI